MTATSVAGRDRPRADRGIPAANRLVLRLLGSPARVLVDGGMTAVRHRAVSTGATTTVPVQYERDGETTVIRCGHASDKRW